ncbi:right-handed parallel beta-helix repeat-containing protein [Spirosoma endophyticum]|uniref:Polymorphic outer membrane protein repeat-containing protein n=1 Tax=Spirosoma endophyticum TaxID=662367 RepID=A0A1I1H249_9BACT|nr:right-handed parallel beta-helix repeat-containing protein [Spirosoma endophyticum]SFC17622.1 polymorphic outer membrane protein repeat-containing protein [Spirosoma endophyticum]
MIHFYSPRIAITLSFVYRSITVLLLLISSLLVCATSTSAQTIRYVSTTGSNVDPTTANSWSASTANLQGAINSLSATGGEVWVAAGTYKPTTSTDRTISFSLKNGVTIYGGFPASGNPGLSERSPASFTTTLSGDIGVVGSTDDNSYHVIYNPASLSLGSTAVLDGFVVTAGNSYTADNSNINTKGAGMYNDGSSGSSCSPTIINTRFTSNTASYGSGMYNNASNVGISSPTVINCSFDNNTSAGGAICNDGGGIASIGISNPELTNCSFSNNFTRGLGEGSGGGIFNIRSNPKLVNCSFISNVVGALGMGLGGGIYNFEGSPLLVNCRFVNNLAVWYGGGIYSSGTNSNPMLINCNFVGNKAVVGTGGAVNNYGSNIKFVNCSFSNNTADTGGGAIQSSGITQLTNCILWDNGGDNTFNGTGLTVSYSLLEPTVSGFIDGSHNLTTTTSPFISDADLRLQAGSLAINAGSTVAYSASSGPATDAGGNVRIQGLIDMGAYESSFVPDLIPILYTQPSTQYGTTNFTMVMDVFELNSVPTQGLVTVYITKDPLVSLSFYPASTTVGGHNVQNGNWTFDGISNDNFYLLTTTQAIVAKGKKSFGLTGIATPGNSKGSFTITTTIANSNGEEVKAMNNTDADKIDYFKQ